MYGCLCLVFVLGMIAGIVFLLSSTLLVADHEFPSRDELDIVTMVPVSKVLSEGDKTIVVNETDREELFRTFRKWNAKRKSVPYYVQVRDQFYRLYSGTAPFHVIRDYQRQHNHPPMLIYSDGYQPMNSLHCAPIRSILKAGIVPGVLVSVGYPCDLWWRYRQFNYSQGQDVKTLRFSVESVLNVLHEARDERTRIVMAGGSKGGLTTLHFLGSLQEELPKQPSTTKLLERITHALVFCPITDFYTSTHGLGFGGACLRFWCPRLMPNYKTKPKALTDIRSFPNIPLFVSCLRRDTFVAAESIDKVLSHLVTVGPLSKTNVRRFVSEEPLPHGQVGKDPRHTPAVRDFFGWNEHTQRLS